MKKILIVEDDFLAAENLKLILSNHGYEVTGIVDKYEQFQKSITEKVPDLVLIDIKLKSEKNGIYIARELRVKWEIDFIFITGQGDDSTYLEAKKEFPVQYILKPIVPRNILITIDLMFNNKEKDTPQNPEHPTLNKVFRTDSNHGTTKHLVPISEIQWIESRKRYLAYHTENQHYIEVNSLKSEIEKLSHYNFARIHRNYAINLKFVQSVNDTEVTLLSGMSLPISRNYKKIVSDYLKDEELKR